MNTENGNFFTHYSKVRDVYFNLALEEYLLLNSMTAVPILLFSVNDPCVVIGKHQNPWRECALGFMESSGIKLARRISGGGAVYHDCGNLNYSFIFSKQTYAEHQCHEVVLKALSDLGLNPELRNKNSIFIADKKVSGTAFCHKRKRVAHHGTLLIDADLDRLRKALRPEAHEIETHAVESIRSPVANLIEFVPSLTAESVAAAIRRRFAEYTGFQPVMLNVENDVDPDALVALRRERSRAEWILGETPRFKALLPVNGRGRTEIHVEHGRVIAVASTDQSALTGKCFNDVIAEVQRIADGLSD